MKSLQIALLAAVACLVSPNSAGAATSSELLRSCDQGERLERNREARDALALSVAGVMVVTVVWNFDAVLLLIAVVLPAAGLRS